MQPQRIGKYRIDGVLGSGAMGIVYRGFDPGVGRNVAIKTVRKELLDGQQPWNAVERFRREARAAGRLSHPNIVTVHDFGEDDDSAYLVCEYVAGVALDRWLKQHGRCDAPTLLAWMGQLLTALEYAHAHGVVHRDVKAANLLVVQGRQIKLADFGIAHVDSPALTDAGMLLGTPSCMAPEQILQQPVDGRADVFAAGVLLYSLLTGARPFTGSPEQAMQQILDVTPPPPSRADPAVPAAFDTVVARALAREAVDRHASAADFLAALRAAAVEAGHADPAGPWAAAAAAFAGQPGLSADATLVLPSRGHAAPQASTVLDGPAPGRPPSPLSPGGSPGPGGSGASGRSLAWPAEALEQLETSLREHVGPIARVLVRKTSHQAATFGELASQLALAIPAETARLKFLAACSHGVSGTGARHTAAGSAAQAGGDRAPKAPRHGPGRAADLPTRAKPGPWPLALDDATTARVQQRLAMRIGPMAALAVRRALRDADSVQALVEQVAAQVPDAADRQRFLGEFGVPSAA